MSTTKRKRRPRTDLENKLHWFRLANHMRHRRDPGTYWGRSASEFHAYYWLDAPVGGFVRGGKNVPFVSLAQRSRQGAETPTERPTP